MRTVLISSLLLALAGCYPPPQQKPPPDDPTPKMSENVTDLFPPVLNLH